MVARGSGPASRAGRRAGAAAEDVRRLGRNGIALLLAYALPRVLTFGATVLAARVLGAASYGAYGTAAALAVILSIVATLGMMPLLIREMARSPDRAPALLAAAHRIKTVANAVMLLALLATARWILGYPDTVVIAALLLGVAYAIGAYVENLAAYFQAVERMGVWARASAVYGAVTGALGAALVLATASVVWFCVAPVAGQIAALVWLLARAPAPVRAAVPFRTAAAARGIPDLLGALAPFTAAFVALTVYYKVDVLLLARWRPDADVGVYVAAYTFIDILHALTLVAAGAAYPGLSRAAPRALSARSAAAASSANGGAGSGSRWAGTRLMELGLMVAVAAAAVLWLLRAPVIGILYGDEFATSVAVLGWLAPAVPALVLNLLAGYVLGAAGHMRPVAAGYAAAALLNVGLNAWLIPVWGAEGAAAAMLVSEIALAGCLLAVLRTRAAAAPGPRAVTLAAAAALAAVPFAVAAQVARPAAAGAAGVTVAAVLAAGYVSTVAVLYWRGRVLAPAERRALLDSAGLARARRQARAEEATP